MVEYIRKCGLLRGTCLEAWLLAFLFLFLVQGREVKAATYTVGLEPGYDFQTITAGMARAEWGDTVLVAPGNYSQDTGETFPIELKNGVRLYAEYLDSKPVLFNYRIAPLFYGINLQNNENIVNGFVLTNAKRAILSENMSLKIYNCIISSNAGPPPGGGGVYATDSNIVFSNCFIKDNYSYYYSREKTEGGGILSYGGKITLVNCIFSNNRSYSHGPNFESPSGISMWGHFTGINSIFVNNYVAAERLTIKNSILIKSDIYGTGEISYSNSDPKLVEDLVSGPGMINLDPLFVDATNEDFHLSANSPCINTGTTSNAPLFDFDGQPRPDPLSGLVDMGADEYYPGYLTPSPTSTYTPTITPFPSSTPVPTSTPSPSPSSRPTPTPLPRNSFLGGYWDTSLTGGQAGAFNIVALAPEATGMEVYAGGSPTGVMVPPFGPGGLFWLLYPSVRPPPEASGTRAYLELVAMYPPPDPWQSWPALTVKP